MTAVQLEEIRAANLIKETIIPQAQFAYGKLFPEHTFSIITWTNRQVAHAQLIAYQGPHLFDSFTKIQAAAIYLETEAMALSRLLQFVNMDVAIRMDGDIPLRFKERMGIEHMLSTSNPNRRLNWRRNLQSYHLSHITTPINEESTPENPTITKAEFLYGADYPEAHTFSVIHARTSHRDPSADEKPVFIAALVVYTNAGSFKERRVLYTFRSDDAMTPLSLMRRSLNDLAGEVLNKAFEDGEIVGSIGSTEVRQWKK
ncbi:hypothetical protein BDV95DRAFT_596006 [Massariosphaeria phaeospora]|uniref:Uncharacterized protein n=1 Tax=Massariosphaeria phaeospora TaxID=100035 RepID=A0A7C8I374_9PLEO|nr:hypothetical protein BDV95DRAFT_596006 [Massariosphaeria phaeospora]